MSAQSLLHRLLRHLQREVWQRRLPHGLLGPRYLWPGQDERIRIHRQLWWRSAGRWPRPLWLLLQTWLWLRWVFWHASPACLRALQRYGAIVEGEEQLARRVQGWRLFKLAMLWCISPVEAYRFRLYRNPASALDYVYDRECAAYHAWRSEPLGWSQDSLRVLQDKTEFTKTMAALGIPVVPILARATQGSQSMNSLIGALRQVRRVFCKMNSGNQGCGAFAAWVTPTGLAGRRFTGQSLPDTSAVEAAWRELLGLDDVLIQPCLTNHPALAPLACNEDVITLRFISQWEEGDARQPPTRLGCLSASLEVPAGKDEKGTLFYAILPIQPGRGVLGAPSCQGVAPPALVQTALARVTEAASLMVALPGWQQIVETSYLAHQRFADVRAIAWDWVLTPAGIVLLEGNSGWGVAVPQVHQKGFFHEFPK